MLIGGRNTYLRPEVRSPNRQWTARRSWWPRLLLLLLSPRVEKGRVVTTLTSRSYLPFSSLTMLGALLPNRQFGSGERGKGQHILRLKDSPVHRVRQIKKVPLLPVKLCCYPPKAGYPLLLLYFLLFLYSPTELYSLSPVSPS
jgi:hypothetical protein